MERVKICLRPSERPCPQVWGDTTLSLKSESEQKSLLESFISIGMNFELRVSMFTCINYCQLFLLRSLMEICTASRVSAFVLFILPKPTIFNSFACKYMYIYDILHIILIIINGLRLITDSCQNYYCQWYIGKLLKYYRWLVFYCRLLLLTVSVLLLPVVRNALPG